MTVHRVLLVPHTHHDVGYTASPRIVDDRHRAIVGEVLRLAGADESTGPERFRWTFEVARPVLRFLATATPDERARLRRLVADGRVSVTGGYLNMTQLPSAAELEAAYELLAAADLPARTEQHGDVNGIAWGTVEAMRRAGLTRLVMALNPDHGRPPFEQPSGFWWEGISGTRVFVWLSTHYGVGEEWGIGPIDDAVTPAEVALFGRDLAVPLAARQYAGPAAAGPTGLRIEPAGALLAEVRPVPGGVRVRLRNPGDRPVTATVAWAGRLNPVTVPAHEIADVVMLASPGRCG